MNLNELLRAKNINIDPQDVLVLRHTPKESRLKRALPQLAAEKPDVFNAYQQTQGAAVEKAMKRAKFVASFIGHEPGKALLVGLYRVGEVKPLTQQEYWTIPELIEMRDKYGMKGFDAKGEGRLIYPLVRPLAHRCLRTVERETHRRLAWTRDQLV